MVQEERSDTLCSVYCQQLGIDCIGTSRTSEPVGKYFGGFVLVEELDNWGPIIEKQEGILGEINQLIRKYQEATGIVWKLQAIKSDNPLADDSKSRVICYRNTNSRGLITNLEKESYEINRTEIITLVPEIFKYTMSEFLLDPNNTTCGDILVCNHSERDVCCGKFGYPIYKHLNSLDQNDYSIWRTSHIGGHRTAPTMIVFNKNHAKYWGYLNQEVAEKLAMHVDLSKDEINKHYRGLSGLSPELQVVERNAWVKYLNNWNQEEITIAKTILGDEQVIKIKSRNYTFASRYTGKNEKVEIGQTKCAVVKPAIVYPIINLN